MTSFGSPRVLDGNRGVGARAWNNARLARFGRHRAVRRQKISNPYVAHMAQRAFQIGH